jgi:purine nucleosidase
MTSRVLLNHDAAIDEYMATILLTTMAGVDLQGIVVTNADCIAAPAMETAWKIQSFIGRTDIPLSLSHARGYNPFPWPYRSDCVKEGALNALQPYGPNPAWPPFLDGEEAMAGLLAASPDDSVTMLVTCPMTTLYNVLTEDPELARKIRRMIWMGGAVNVLGNLDPATLPPAAANPYAEWNAFWDPYAVDWVFKNTRFPIVIFPLDVTNQAVISKPFQERLLIQGKTCRYSDLARQSYEIVAGESFYDMWDVVTACYVSRPDLFVKPTAMKIEIVTAFPNQGALIQSPQGRDVEVVFELADKTGFYDYVLEQFRR